MSQRCIKVVDTLRIARDPGRAVLVVTHDPRTRPFVDRMMRMEGGRILEDAPEFGADARGKTFRQAAD